MKEKSTLKSRANNYLIHTKKQKGITLIALVVTIVILLILAGITINAIMGEGGLINRAKTAQEKTEEGKEEDINAINDLTNQVKELVNGIGNGNGNTPQGPLAEYKQASMLTKQTNTVITLGSYEVTIPAGYMVTADSGNTVEEGIVITDAANDGNEWVWVPVSNSELSTMYVDSSANPIQLWGTTATNARTNYYTASGIIEGITRAIPGEGSSYREPDLVIGSDSNSYDAVDTNRIQAGFYTVNGANNVADTLDQMATKMVEEYENMLNSTRTNKGFYIGRYELGKESSTDTTAVVKRNKDVKTNTSWYEFYSDCKGLAKAGTNTTTRMIYGLQWDATCNWLKLRGFNTETDSTTWGNYSNYNTANGYEEGDAEYIELGTTGSKKQTGYSNNWSACNIYNFAGNCYEWTQEASITGKRVNRGGVYSTTGSDNPASYCVSFYTTSTSYSYGRLSPHFNN